MKKKYVLWASIIAFLYWLVFRLADIRQYYLVLSRENETILIRSIPLRIIDLGTPISYLWNVVFVFIFSIILIKYIEKLKDKAGYFSLALMAVCSSLLASLTLGLLLSLSLFLMAFSLFSVLISYRAGCYYLLIAVLSMGCVYPFFALIFSILISILIVLELILKHNLIILSYFENDPDD